MKLKAVIRAILIALVILSGAIALPILFRPFYWWHIKPYGIPEYMDMTVAQIKQAYGEMLDYCMGLSGSFSVGVLPFSQSGADHFADVRKLFLLDLSVLLGAAVLLTALLLVKKKRTVLLAGHTPGFWSCLGLGSTFILIGSLAALDFDKAFEVFHKLFFPGKDNWLFDSRYDPVINMLPAEFFRNCALLILGVILLSCGLLIFLDIQKRKKTRCL